MYLGCLVHSRPSGSKIALVWLTCSCTWVCMLACMQKLWESGGMLPQEMFLNLMLWDGFWGYFGTQNITTRFVVMFWVICADDTQTSRLKAKGQKCYLSQNIGPAIARPAGPAPPPLTGVLTIQFSITYSMQEQRGRLKGWSILPCE